MLQITIGVQAPSSYAASGSIGSSTASGSCATTVGETSYVTATFVNNAFCLLKFTASTTWTVPTGVVAFDILIVGGGGGGGADGGGGGGGGGVGTVTGITATAGLQATVTIGAGGSGSSHTPSIGGSAGGTSSVAFNGSTFSAYGGAVAGGYSPNANYAAAGSVSANVTRLNTDTMGQGGRNSVQTSGGFGTAGSNGASTSFVTGSSMYFAGGGGGGTCAPGNNAVSNIGLPGGEGGGGRGSQHTQYVGSDAGQPGTNGLGGGGGGGSACDDGPGNVYGTYQRTAGGRGGDGVIYIKFVPVVLLTTNPQSASGAIGATSTFTAGPYSTISGATRTKKWQVLIPGGSWTDIASTNSDSYVTPTLTRSMHRNQYRYVVTDTVGTAVSSTYSASATLSVLTPKGETDTAITSSAPTTGYTTAAGADEITPGSGEAFTIEAWIHPTNACSVRCTIAAREGAFRLTFLNNKISFVPWNGTLAPWQDLTTGYIPLNSWSHVALVRNGTSFKVFINSSQVASYTLTYAPSANLGSRFFVASINTDGAEPFFGSIDELKVWKSDRSASLSSDMNSNETSTSTLSAYWNFNEGSGLVSYNQVPTATADTDLTFYSANYWDANVVSSVATSGPYTIRKFYRSYITSLGGWKVPTYISAVTTLIVGGGGGGGYNSGSGGGGGGVSLIPRNEVSEVVSVVVGTGGNGAVGSGTSTPNFAARNGTSSNFGAESAPGGNAGSTYPASGGAAVTTSTTTSGAGGAGSPSSSSPGSAGGTGYTSTLAGSSLVYGSGGGGGGWATSANGGAGGSGAGSGGTTSSNVGGHATAYQGGGGGGSSAYVSGGNGGSGIVVVRWITAQTPTYTKPSNAYLNVGMTETFTTNVAQDSATAVLTRTFKWESSTTGTSGTFSLIKQGTGASNSAFSWVPTDTSTSGSNFVYRLTVTDSDTMGLFITDSSTAYAVINRPLNVSGSSTIPKAINLAKSETFTITLGTPTYRASLSPTIAGINLDTSTAGFAVIKISETMTVGTWLETLTVTDSVSAGVVIPLSIQVTEPPNILNTGQIVRDGLILNLEAGNSKSLLLGDTTTATSAVWRDLSGSQNNAQTSGTFDARSCVAPTYYTSYGGYLEFNGSNNCYRASDVGMSINKSFTAEAWFRMNSASWNGSASIISQNWPSANNVNLVLGGANGSGNLKVGFYNGAWYTSTTGYTPVKGRWTHVVGKYDGATLQLFIDGLRIDSTNVTAGLTGGINSNGYSIGKSWGGDYFFNGSIAAVRIYNRAISESEILQNYNSTKARFDLSKISLIKPTKKYGTILLDSFTATSGYGSKVASLSTGDRSGIDWDTTTVVNQINLSLQESLTVGLYTDTITVTDSLGQSTYLPMIFTVTKADTVTVTMGSSANVIYSGAVPATAPRATISGLVGVDSATVETLYTGTTSSGGTCATGGACAIGDIGPGGGYVFYHSPTVINKVSGISDGGIYLEIAPYASRQGSVWSNTNAAANGTLATVGSGAANTNRIITQLGTNGVAATASANFTYGGKSDWFLPSTDELYQAYLNLKVAGLGDLDGVNYWSSTEVSGQETSQAYNYWMGNNNNSGATSKTLGLNWRPIRAFSPTTLDTTTAPIEVDTYTAMGSNLTFSIGAASNYQAVVYETSTLAITQANQAKLTLNLYGAIAGSPFTLQVSGGSGSGALTETVTAGSTAANCRISNHVLSNDTPSTQQLSCNIKITKASSRNYKEETLTATVYFMLFQGQPTGQTGSGSTIGLNGQTSLSIADTNTVQAPIISSFSNSGTLDLGAGQTLSIFGSGFTGQVIVKFWRNKSTVPITPTNTGEIRVLPQLVPTGALSGPVTVILSNGATAVSGSSLTIVGVYIAPTI